MSKALEHDHPPVDAWTRPLRVWFRACDDCGKWRITQELHEVYPEHGSNFGWWFSCTECLADDTNDFNMY